MLIRNQSIDLRSKANQLTGFYMRATLALNGLKTLGKAKTLLTVFTKSPIIEVC